MQIKGLKIPQEYLVIALSILVIAGLLGVNLQFARGNPGGNDFLVHYVGTRSFLYEGISPYSEEVALRIQNAAYGHAAQGIEHELRVAYPLYSIVVFAPFSVIGDFQLARAVWMTVLELSLVAMGILSFALTEWKPSLLVQGIVLLFSVVWYHAVRGIVNGNAVILIALALTLILYLIRRGNDRGAGVLLALTTIKPHLVVLLIPYLLVWAWLHKRRDLLLWFTGTLLILFVLAWILLPNWILQNIWEILRYPDYNPAGTLAAALGEWVPGFAVQLKWGIAVLLGGLLLFEWFQTGRGGYQRFLWTSLLTIVISQWIGIQTDPGNFILLFPALIYILSVLARKWPDRELGLTAAVLGTLLIGLWVLFVLTIQRSYQPVQNPVMFLPLPAVCLLGLYWIKWWVVGAHTPLRIAQE